MTTWPKSDRQAVWLLVALALVIRLLGLQNLSLWGDEILSLRDASQLGRTWNGLLYFLILHVVTIFTTDSFWLRLPAILMGAAATIPFFFFLKNVLGPGAARLGALLYALSPFAVLYSQEVRFYGLYLLAGALSLLLLSNWEPGTGLKRTTGLFSGWVLLLLAHFLSILAVIGQAISVLWLALKRRGRVVLVAVLGIVGICGVVLVAGFPVLAGQIYEAIFFRVGAAAGTVYSGARGISLSGLAKIPFTFYFFALGENVHPFTWWISVPAVVVAGYLLVRGFWKSRSTSSRLWLYAWTLLMLPIAILFLVLDPLSDPDSGLAAPKYIAFALFPFVALITQGVITHSKQWKPTLAAGAIAVSVAGLWAYFAGDWSYNTHKLTHWQTGADTVLAWEQPGTLLVADGRSNDEWSYYLAGQDASKTLSLDILTPTSILPQQSDIVVSAYPANNSTLGPFNQNLRTIQARRVPTGGYYQNNLTILRYSSTPPPISAHPNALIPYDLIDTRYIDLTLPQHINLSGEDVQVEGGFTLGPGRDLDTRNVSIVQGQSDSTILEIVSNGTELAGVAQGTAIAQIEIKYSDGSSQILPIRMGIETADWTGKCSSGLCKQVFTWTKRAQLTGGQSTATSWQQFQASWFAADIPIANTKPTSAQLHYLLDKGQLQVWSILFR